MVVDTNNHSGCEKNPAMVHLDGEFAREYLQDCGNHAATAKIDLLALEVGGSEIDEDAVSRVIRAVHAIGGGGFFGLVAIRDLARQMEEVLELLRSRKMVPTAHRVRLLVRATERLHQLTQNPHASNQADITETMGDLASLCADNQVHPTKSRGFDVEPALAGQPVLRALLVEDDAASGLLLQRFLSRYGECHLVTNGREAVEAFRAALEEGQRYTLVCMDVMMPGMNGREAVRQIRAIEKISGIRSIPAVRIIMTTAVTDAEEVFRCFRESCDAYLVKPIELLRLLGQMKAYKLVQ